QPSLTPWLDLRVDHRFPGCHLDLHCQLAEQRTVVFGPSGSGKSSLLRAIAGLLEPDAGRIELHGQAVWERPGRVLSPCVPTHKRRVGLVLQSPALFPHLRVRDNVAFALRSMAADKRKEEVFELLRIVDALAFAERWPQDLSGGQQQRVAIARTLAANPAVLLLDEPFGALDAEASRQLSGNIYHWAKSRRVPVMMVTHNVEEAFSGGDEVLKMDCGRITAQGSPHDVLSAERARLLGVLRACGGD
ncbi:MAG TPA: ATP-binding cassette domain-containing protein, partial [Acidobacteriaceae bacterium]|nr:ATP-binding cassette domain-containing protein [Acidobacteriaceae bacterium]